MPAPAPVQRILQPAEYYLQPITELRKTDSFTLGGAPARVDLDPHGYLELLVVHIEGAFTGANAALVFNALMPWNVVTEFDVLPPNSAVAPVRLGGQGLHVWNHLGKDFAPLVNGAQARDLTLGTLDANAYDATLADAFPTATGAQVVHLWYVLPFHRSAADIRGIIPMGGADRTSLVMRFAAKAEVVTVAANLTSDAWSYEVFHVQLTPPPAGAPTQVDALWRVAYDEGSQPIVATGEQIVELDPNEIYLGILHGIVLNNALNSADVSRIKLRGNKSDLLDPAGVTGELQTWLQRRQGNPLPVGFFIHNRDLFEGSIHDMRRWLYTGHLETLESRITIASGATLGSVARLWSWTRRLIDINPAGATFGAG